MGFKQRAANMTAHNLIGIGLYTPAEASRLLGVPSGKIIRWLRGHRVGDQGYSQLWRPEIDLGDDRVYLGFRDLMEIRVADAFISRGLSAQKVRRAIELAREMIGEERPLSTARFRTDGRTVFLQLKKEDGSDEMVDLFLSQHVFRDIIEPSLKNIEFVDGIPSRWWPRGKQANVVVDPQRSFGQPIEAESNVPTAVLAAAAEAEGSVEAAARMWSVSPASIRKSIEFQEGLDRLAA
jgi:uncharacterized protein (DUF433 family)